MSNGLSIISANPADRLQALKVSRLNDLIQDKGLLSRIYEATVNLLSDDKLRACDPDSILGALYKAASLGFRLERDFGECFLIPRNINAGTREKPVWKSVCTFQIGYKGWKAISLQTGIVSFMESREVYTEDKFDFEYGSGAFLKHKPAPETQGQTAYFYARAKLKDGQEIFEVITKQAAEKNRRFSESQYNGTGQNKTFSAEPKDIWKLHYAAMALRIPIKKLCAALPLTAATENAINTDGSVTYLQKDGTVTTILPADVERTAEHPENEVVQIKDASLQEKYDDLKSDLGGIPNVAHLITFYENFTLSVLGGDPVFVELIYLRAVELCKTLDQINTFYKAAEFWKTNTKLTGILSKRKKEIINATTDPA